jgi:hypothetical protein
MERMANALDTRFRLLGIRFGWDSILGLIPGLGDVATAIPGAVMIAEAARMGARKRVLARMAFNTGIDMVIGGIPLIGDAFDVVFKSHRRNIALLSAEIDKQTRKEDRIMTDRYRSKDGKKDSDGFVAKKEVASGQGREGGTLQRDIATSDEMKRAATQPAGKTRVTKSKERKD